MTQQLVVWVMVVERTVDTNLTTLQRSHLFLLYVAIGSASCSIVDRPTADRLNAPEETASPSFTTT